MGGVLSIDETVEVFPYLRGMGKHDLDIVFLEVNEGIERFFGHVLLEEIGQASLREVAPAIIGKGKACIEEGVVLHHGLDELVLVLVASEELAVGTEDYSCPRGLCSRYGLRLL